MGKKITCPLEMEILTKIGNNKTNEKTFHDGIILKGDEINELLGFYTYRGDVCILDGLGMDVEFSSYSDENKVIIHEAIMNDKYGN
jgi:hypothetical protein